MMLIKAPEIISINQDYHDFIGLIKQATFIIETRNAMGGIVFEKLSFHGDLMNIDLSGFARGLYIVKIEDGRKSSTRKVLKVE
jgi:hypothetical protein